MKNNDPEVEFGFYRLDKEFLESAHEISPAVRTDAVYIGPAAEVDINGRTMQVFIPLADDDTDRTVMEKMLQSNIFMNLNYNAMIPVASSLLLTPANDELDPERVAAYIKNRRSVEKMAENQLRSHFGDPVISDSGDSEQ